MRTFWLIAAKEINDLSNSQAIDKVQAMVLVSLVVVLGQSIVI
jgi:hypothetical protein